MSLRRIYFIRYTLMLSVYILLFILVAFNFEIELNRMLFIYGTLAIVLINIRILHPRLGNFIVLPIISYTITLLLVYVGIIGFSISLGVIYAILFTGMILLNGLPAGLDNMLKKIFETGKVDAELPFMWMLLFIAYMFSFLSEASMITDYVYYLIYVIAGPLVEGLLISSDYYSKAMKGNNCICSRILFINALYITLIFYPNLLYMIISIIGNLSKIILGFKKGLVIDYVARTLIVTKTLLGVL